MNSDRIVTVKEGIYQHGKVSSRIYLMKLNYFDAAFINRLEELALSHEYTKIIAKIPSHITAALELHGFKTEAVIPAFYNGVGNCCFMSKYYSHERSRPADYDTIQTILRTAKSKSAKLPSAEGFEIKILSSEHIPEMAQLYKSVFKTYPFPIFRESYLQETMENGSIYFGVFNDGKLVACASSETDPVYENAEMTDFGVLAEYRGRRLSSLLLRAMENKMRTENYKTLYTIARAHSYGMNRIFGENGYKFGGILYNNTQISGAIESMNVWYKSIK